MKHIINKNFFYKIVFLAIVIFILIVVMDYKKNWVNPQSVQQIKIYMAEGPPFSLKEYFQLAPLPGDPRLRHVAYFFSNLNCKLRNILMHYIPPHPSIGIYWLLALLTAFMGYKYIENLVSTEIAWVSLLLFIASAGLLSNITCHAIGAKSVVLFITVLCFYITSEKIVKKSFQENNYKPDVRIYIIISLLFLISFFTDEYAFISFSVFPVIFYDNLKKIKFTQVLIFFIIPVLIFVIAVLFSESGEMFIRYITVSKSVLPEDGWHNFGLLNFLKNINAVLFSHMIPYSGVIRHANDNNIFSMYSYFIAMVIFIYFFKLYRGLTAELKSIFIKSLTAAVIVLLLYSIMSQFHGAIIYAGSYYYANIFSFFWIFPVSILLAQKYNPVIELINKILLLYIIIVNLYNFNIVNAAWIRDHYSSEQPLARKYIVNIWKDWRKGIPITELQRKYPEWSTVWLFEELKYVKKNEK